MVLLHTPALDKQFKAPDFRLKSTSEQEISLDDICAPYRAAPGGLNGLVVAFICNHCPYVLTIIDNLVADFHDLAQQNIACVAIMPNDTAAYPQDGFDNMVTFAADYGFDFPYLIDDSQEVARAYGAVCTPDFFGFDRDLTLQYRGRLDDSKGVPTSLGPEFIAPNGRARELYHAMTTIAQQNISSASQIPSMGCSIKWR